jgi:hypothetical protein
MMEELYKQANIKEFLNYFPSRNWKSIIFLLLDYSILNIEKQYNMSNITFNQIYTLVNDMKSSTGILKTNDKKFTNTYFSNINSPNKSVTSFITMKSMQSAKAQKIEEALNNSPKAKKGKFVVIDEDENNNEVIIKLNKATYDQQIKTNNKTLIFDSNKDNKAATATDILDKLKQKSRSNFYDNDIKNNSNKIIKPLHKIPIEDENEVKYIIKKLKSKEKPKRKKIIIEKYDSDSSQLSDLTNSYCSSKEKIIVKGKEYIRKDKKYENKDVLKERLLSDGKLTYNND